VTAGRFSLPAVAAQNSSSEQWLRTVVLWHYTPVGMMLYQSTTGERLVFIFKSHGHYALSLRVVRYCQLPPTPKPTVIVVDDDLSIRRALRMQLQVAGFNVLVFQSGESLLGSDSPTNNACLLLDVYMPGMSGIELCRSLAAAGRRLPTVLMSASDDELTRRVMCEAKTVASLFKPFDEKALLHAIRKALRKQSS
jgi:CheY-like chemotaxis protein